MCGIAGIAALNGFDPVALIEATHLVKYRGPDGYGFAYFSLGQDCPAQMIINRDGFPHGRPQVGLGHRRLAILDLSPLGSQPMRTRDNSLCIVFNGEIYNYLEIREELRAQGYVFNTRTDTEVLLHAYREWGSECLHRFNGMWSFAIWDQRQGRLFCARDRLGIKPFYYYCDSTRFLFASEIKQIIGFPGVPRHANPARVAEFLESGILNHSAETLFQGIHELRGGHFLTLDLAFGKIDPRVKRYWNLTVDPRYDIPEDDACEEFTASFKDAVRLRMRSDVSVGSCLSGGLDSSAIVSTANTLIRHETFHTFSACFEEPQLDEREYIREAVAAANVTSHLVFPNGESFCRSLERLAWHQDEPVAGSSVFAQQAVMEAARREGVPVLLDGQGGDETLCGYRKFYYFYLWHLLKNRRARVVPEALHHFLGGDCVPVQWSDAARYIPAPLRKNGSVLERLGPNSSTNNYHSPTVDIGPGSSLAARQKDDIVSLSLPALLRYEDRNSMASSIETRLPFLDYRLVEFLVNCPESLKLRAGQTKWILRKVMKGILPDKIRLRRRKLGFDTPEQQWMRGPVRPVLEQLFADSQLRMSPFLEAAKVRNEYKAFYEGRRGALSASELFRPLMLEVWGRVHDVAA